MRSGDHPEIFVVSLDPEKALSAEYLKGTFFWHIDGATDDVPTKATMLNAVGVAAAGEASGPELLATWLERSATNRAGFRTADGTDIDTSVGPYPCRLQAF